MRLFTSEELYVISSLLGAEFIVGVEGKTFENNRSDLKGMFQRNYSDLDNRGIIEYKIDGTLLVEREVRELVRVLNKADDVFVVITDRNGSTERVNYLSYEGSYCRLTVRGSQYLTEIMEGFSYGSILNSYNISIPEKPIKEIRISLNDYKEIDSQYKSFNKEEADEHLSNILQDAEAERLIRECMLRQNMFFILKEYRRIGGSLVSVDNLVLRFLDNYILKFCLIGTETIVVRVYRKEKN